MAQQFQQTMTLGIRTIATAFAAGMIVAVSGCAGGGHDEKPATNTSSRVTPLANMFRITTYVRLRDTPQTAYQCYVAQRPAQRDEGLSYVSDEELLSAPGEPGRGMVFVYPDNRTVAFAGRNTIINLDVVYAVGVGPGIGQIVDITTIDAFQRALRVSSKPVQYVLMVRRGDLARSGAKIGDFLYVPVNTPKQ